MRALLEHLERSSRTLTIYGYTGTDDQLRSLSTWLDSYGIHVRTVETNGSDPGDVAVLHQEGEILGACSVSEFLARSEFESAIAGDTQPPIPELLSDLGENVAVKPNRSVREMIRISREYERRALREGAGSLHAGFQQLSQIATSSRTMEVYTELAREGVDVWVYGYPNADLGDVPFTVVEDTNRDLERHWFLLYDGDGNPARKAALVSEECSPEENDRSPVTTPQDGERSSYDSFFTTDPAVVDELFALAREEYGDVFAGVE